MATTLTQDLRGPQILYAGTGAGLWCSNLERARWEQVGLKSKNLMAIAVSRANPQRLLAGDADERVYCGDDGGRTW